MKFCCMMKLGHELCPLHAKSLSGPYFLNKFVCVEVLRPSQPNGVMSSAVSLPKHTFTGQGYSKRLTSIVLTTALLESAEGRE